MWRWPEPKRNWFWPAPWRMWIRRWRLLCRCDRRRRRFFLTMWFLAAAVSWICCCMRLPEIGVWMNYIENAVWKRGTVRNREWISALSFPDGKIPWRRNWWKLCAWKMQNAAFCYPMRQKMQMTSLWHICQKALIISIRMRIWEISIRRQRFQSWKWPECMKTTIFLLKCMRRNPWCPICPVFWKKTSMSAVPRGEVHFIK